MLTDFPLQRLSEFGSMSPAELAMLDRAVDPPVRLARLAIMRSQGDAPDSIYLLQEGWACSSVTLPSGERQLTKIHLPGDFMGVPSVCLTESVDTIFALTPVIARKLSAHKLGELFSSLPGLAARLYLFAQRERVILMDRLSALGAKRAVGRLAALLLDLHERLSKIGLARDHEFVLRLTQDEIGDYLGLTAVHVNRTFRQLEDGGLIERRLQRIKLLKFDELAEVSGYVSRSIDERSLDIFRSCAIR